MAVFLWNETRSRSPLVPLTIFKRTLTGANVIGFGLGTVIFGIFFMLSLYMQQVLGFSAIQAGLGYLAVALTVVVAASISQGLVTKSASSRCSWRGWPWSRPGWSTSRRSRRTAPT